MMNDQENSSISSRVHHAGKPGESSEAEGRSPRWALRWTLTLVALVALGVTSPYLVATIGVLLILIVAHEAGHFLAARATGMKAPEFMVGFGPLLFGATRGETTWGLRAIPLGGYVRIIGMHAAEELAPEDEHRAYRAKPAWQRILVSFAGPAANLLCAVLLLTVVYAGFGPSRETMVVGAVVPGTPAATAGLLPGDVLFAVDGVVVDDMTDYRNELQGTTGEAALTLVRQGERLTVDLVPVEQGGRKIIGVETVVERAPEGLMRSVGRSVVDTGTAVGATFVAVADVFVSMGTYITAMFTGDLPDDERLLSPVGVSQVAAQNSDIDIPWLLGIAALVNISLATFNLFPVPPLDGGHIVVAATEGTLSKVRRKPIRISSRILNPVTFAFWSLLILLGVSTLWLDITQPIQLP